MCNKFERHIPPLSPESSQKFKERAEKMERGELPEEVTKAGERLRNALKFFGKMLQCHSQK